jgi:hypothetical protein
MFGVTGCQPESEREFLVVSFDPAETKKESLRYRLISERKTEISLDSSAKKSKKNKPHKSSERLELVIAYTPVEIDPYGLTIVEGICESAKAKRTSSVKGAQKEAVESMAGKSFRFKISPSGQIADYSQINKLLRQVSEKAFTTSGKKKIKNPDMIFDFIAMQWYLWESVASIKNPHDGVVVGDSWKSLELIPFPVPIRFTRQSTYTLDSITDSPEGRIAEISSSFIYSSTPLKNVPMPYSEGFQIRGIFGFLNKYKVQSINGSGTDILNIDTGVLQSRNLNYKLELNAAFMMPLGNSVPKVSIDQTMDIQLLEDKP